MNSEEVAKIIFTIQSAYSQIRFDEETIKVWKFLLKDADYELSKVALLKHVKTNKFPPTIADFHIKRAINPYEFYERKQQEELEKVRAEESDPVLKKKREQAKERMKQAFMTLKLEKEGAE